MSFKLYEGSLSPRYNIFNDYTFKECYATNTRLMGALAMRIIWVSKENHNKYLYQLIHLDYSEYGIDDYREFIVEKNKESLSLNSKFAELWTIWENMSTCLGGFEKKISLDTAINFICTSIKIGEKYYKLHDNHIKEFQKYSNRRINFMLSCLGFPDFSSGFSGFKINDFSFMYELFPDDMSSAEIINYFIMRLSDKDYLPASMLSDFDIDYLKNLELAPLGILSLMRNTLTNPKSVNLSDKKTINYTCKTLLLGKKYYYALSEIGIRKLSTILNYKVNYFNISFINEISEYEAAMQLKHSEYITTFSICDKKEEFPLDSLLMIIKTTPYKVPAGMIYMIYNDNNSHVKNNDYYLDQDVYAAILITENDEVVIMSQDLTKIDMLEKIILSSPLRADIDLLDRYKFENQVFQSFSKTKHLNFSAFIDGYI